MHRITENKVVLTLGFYELLELVRQSYGVQDVELHNIHSNSNKKTVTIILIETKKDNIERVQVPEPLLIQPDPVPFEKEKIDVDIPF